MRALLGLAERGRGIMAKIDPSTLAEPHALGRRAVYLQRHAALALPYLTPHKVANLILNEIELRVARTRPHSVPPYIKVEATPLCHLSCGACHHSSKAYMLDNKMHLTVERITRIIDPIVRELVGVSLSYSGEPLLNRELSQIVRYFLTRAPHLHRLPYEPIRANDTVASPKRL